MAAVRRLGRVRLGPLALLVRPAVQAGRDGRADRERRQPQGLLGEPGGRLPVAAGRPGGDQAAQPPGHAHGGGPRPDGELAPGAGRHVQRPAVHHLGRRFRVARPGRRARGVADADPLADLDRVDRRPGQPVHQERVHHRQAVAILDHLRPQRERVGHAGDQQQDGGQDRAEARRGQPLGGVVGHVGRDERHPHPPEDDWRVQAEGFAFCHLITLCAPAGRAPRRAGRRRCSRSPRRSRRGSRSR